MVVAVSELRGYLKMEYSYELRGYLKMVVQDSVRTQLRTPHGIQNRNRPSQIRTNVISYHFKNTTRQVPKLQETNTREFRFPLQRKRFSAGQCEKVPLTGSGERAGFV